jgi:hypothetical protein
LLGDLREESSYLFMTPDSTRISALISFPDLTSSICLGLINIA